MEEGRQGLLNLRKNSGLITPFFSRPQFQVGLDVTRHELHTALAEAMTNKATVKRWRNGKKAFPTVKDQEPT
jgi:hypothetical protein